MIKRILVIIGVGFMLSLALFSGIVQLLGLRIEEIVEVVEYIPLELRVLFFAGWLAIFWALYNAIVT